MTYYPTLAEDLARAREILKRGRVNPEDMPVAMRDIAHVAGGTIFGVDTYAAYKLLESFVQVIEAVDPNVCEVALRLDARQRGVLGDVAHLMGQRPGVCRTCGQPASAHVPALPDGCGGWA